MTKTLFYPLNYDNREVMLFKDLLIDQFKDCIYAVENENIRNKFLEISTENEIQEFHSYSNYKEALDKCDQVVILPTINKRIEHYKSTVDIVSKNKKTFILDDDYRFLYGLCNNIENISSSRNRLNIKNNNFSKIREELLKIDVPIILIAGLYDYCNKFSLQLLLGKYFKEKGYKVNQYGSKGISPLFNIKQLPNEIGNVKIPMKKRALLLNKFMINEIKEDKPDLIIIDILEGIIPMNESILNNFGEYCRIVSVALPVDYTIVNIYYQNFYTPEYFEMLNNYVTGFMNSELLGLCISNTMFEFKPETQNSEMKFFHLSNKDIHISLDTEMNIPIFCINEKNKIYNFFEKTFEKLTTNIDKL